MGLGCHFILFYIMIEVDKLDQQMIGVILD